MHTLMSILCNDHVLGILGYVIGKCRRSDKILCNRCPLNHEGGMRSDD